MTSHQTHASCSFGQRRQAGPLLPPRPVFKPPTPAHNQPLLSPSPQDAALVDKEDEEAVQAYEKRRGTKHGIMKVGLQLRRLHKRRGRGSGAAWLGGALLLLLWAAYVPRHASLPNLLP